MKFVVCFLLCCLGIIRARHVNNEHFFGDVRQGEVFGMEHVTAEIPTTNHTAYTQFEFTFPTVPSDRPITGIKYIDHHPETRVEFVNGKIGDHQISIKVVALGHDIDATFIFYTKQ